VLDEDARFRGDAPWESHQKQATFPHFHSSGAEGGWKNGKPKAGFPLSHRLGLSRSKQKNRAAYAHEFGLDGHGLPRLTDIHASAGAKLSTAATLIEVLENTGC
jgi:hypothetical protein